MGQRLVIEIEENDENGKAKVLANAYYHWSGYTLSTIYIVDDIIKFINTHKLEDYENSLLYAIRILEASSKGCGLYSLEDLGDMFPDEDFTEAEDRNCGLIEISPEGIESNNSWGGGDVSINISTKKINFGVFYTEDKKEYEENYRNFDYWGDPNDDDIEYPYKIVSDNLDLSNLSFEEFDRVFELFDGSGAFIFESNPNEVISRLE